MKTLSEFKLTLKFNNTLNKKLWDGLNLRPKVRNKLLEIGKAWINYANIPESAVKKYILVGGMAGYNYTKYSDIDLHVIVDKSEIANCENLVDEYLKDKKELWSLRDITIYGHDVELYAQDEEDEFKTSQAVYDLSDNKWLIEPEKADIDEKKLLQDTAIISKVKKYTSYIDHLIEGESNNLETLKKIKEKLKKMRQEGLDTAGEYSIGNLVFKELRNKGVLDKMNDYMQKEEDQLLSLESHVNM